MKQFTRGNITITEIGDECIAMSIEDGITDPETDVIIHAVSVFYIDDMIAALKLYKESTK